MLTSFGKGVFDALLPRVSELSRMSLAIRDWSEVGPTQNFRNAISKNRHEWT